MPWVTVVPDDEHRHVDGLRSRVTRRRSWCQPGRQAVAAHGEVDVAAAVGAGGDDALVDPDGHRLVDRRGREEGPPAAGLELDGPQPRGVRGLLRLVLGAARGS